MTRRILSAVVRALTVESTDGGVHFHQGPTGDPACCYDLRCTSPRLDVSGS
jgi:hypothetical protein